ncbi:MAG: GIY-YIG nuclease family protein [Candidatus Paceibacterota bacterium]|jgi:putative endonuclease
MYFVYILKCSDNSLYTGITNNLERRFKQHKNKKGGAYTRVHPVVKIVHTEKFPNRSDAQKREFEIKSWHRNKKLDLITGQPILPTKTALNNSAVLTKNH